MTLAILLRGSLPRMRRWLLLIVVALAPAGCGSAGPPQGPASVTSNATATRPSATEPTVASTPTSAPATTGTKPSTKATTTGTSTSTSRTPATVPTTTTPVNLPSSKKRKGPRSISVAEPSRAIEPSGGRTAARQLVEAWKGRAVLATDPNTALVQRHLTSLTHKCIEPEATIAGYVRSGIQKYRKYGVIESPVEFSRALDSAVPTGSSDCKIILRTLLAQVEQG
jgi:hypothetical protein